MKVDPSNQAQFEIWDGKDGAYWAANADRFERSLAAYDDALFAAAAIKPTDRVLDVGCGTGATSRMAAARASAGAVLGVDLSAEMLAVARRRAAEQGLTNVTFMQADAQIHRFPPVDLALSRSTAMFFGDPAAAFANLARAVEDRLVLLVWQGLERQEWLLEVRAALAVGRQLPVPPAGVPGPFAFADPDRIRTLVRAAGFADVIVDGVQEPMDFGPEPGAYEWIAGQTKWMLDGLDPERRTTAGERLRAAVAAHRTEQGVRFGSAAWLVTARRV
jgi:SAM-dependent methyltransferase